MHMHHFKILLWYNRVGICLARIPIGRDIGAFTIKNCQYVVVIVKGFVQIIRQSNVTDQVILDHHQWNVIGAQHISSMRHNGC